LEKELKKETRKAPRNQYAAPLMVLLLVLLLLLLLLFCVFLPGGNTRQGLDPLWTESVTSVVQCSE
jgi:hypothetical protein